MSSIHCITNSGTREVLSIWKCEGLAARAIEGETVVQIELPNGSVINLNPMIFASLQWRVARYEGYGITVNISHADELCWHTIVVVRSAVPVHLAVNKQSLVPSSQIRRKANVAQN